MRKLLAVLWLLVPVGLIAYHYGPGQLKLQRDRAARHLSYAKEAEAAGMHKAAYEAYAKALTELPSVDKDARLLTRLSQAKTRMYFGELPEAMEDTESLLSDALTETDSKAIQDQIRSTAGSMHYYVAWLMRLEGAETAEWTEQTEAARQHFRMLSEDAVARGDAKGAQGHEQNLEATIRLARMDLSELKGLPLPKECNGNCNCSGKCRKQKESRTKIAKKPNDARQEISKDKAANAGKNDRPEGGS
jgi:transcriptional regulator with XRE-family HTH domain